MSTYRASGAPFGRTEVPPVVLRGPPPPLIEWYVERELKQRHGVGADADCELVVELPARVVVDELLRGFGRPPWAHELDAAKRAERRERDGR